MNKHPFISVNGSELSTDDAQSLAYMLDGYDIRLSLRTHMAVIEFARARGITLSASDLQDEFDQYRYEAGLEQSETVLQWRQDSSITDDAIKIYCEITAYRKKLAAALTTESVRAAFDEIAHDEMVYYLFFLPLENAEIAHKVTDLIQSDKLTFSEALNQYGDRETKAVGGFMGEMVRSELEKPLRLAASSVEPGTLVGPFIDDEQWYIVHVADRVAPEFEDFEESLRDALIEDDLQYYFDRTVVMNSELSS